MARRIRRTRGKCRWQLLQRYTNRRRRARPTNGKVWPARSPGIPRSRHALRHSRPCGRIRLRERECASKCASSWRKVRSISAGPNFCNAGLSKMRERWKSARPTVVRMRPFQSTRKRAARLSALRARNRHVARSCKAHAGGRSKTSSVSKQNSSCLNGDFSLAAFRIRSLHNLGNNPGRCGNFLRSRVFAERKPDRRFGKRQR